METIGHKWFTSLQTSLSHNEVPLHLFQENCMWRDLLAFDWEIRTIVGKNDVATRIKEKKRSEMKDLSVKFLDESPFASIGISLPDNFLLFHFSFSFDVGLCEGIVRLFQEGDQYVCFSLLTTLQSIHQVVPRTGANRPLGFDVRHSSSNAEVIIIGAGQAGLNLAARLSSLSVSVIVIESNPRVGDNWRKRYSSLHLHDPVWYDHFAFMPFPSTWPVFPSKDRFAEWLEGYANIMDLDVRTNCKVKSILKGANGEWEVICDYMEQNPHIQKFTAKHIVVATGTISYPLIPPIPGIDHFTGYTSHSHTFRLSSSAISAKKVVIVGACTSAYDLAEECLSNGAASVTLIQRSPILPVRSSSLFKYLLQPLYIEGGPPTAFADLLGASFPIPLMRAAHRVAWKKIEEEDAEYYDKLRKAGLRVHFGDDGSGLFPLFLSRGGGYYIDTGGTDLVIKGDIRVIQGHPTRIGEKEIELDSGDTLPADILLFATGYHGMQETVRSLFGEEVASSIGEVWGIDDETLELKNMYRPCKEKGVWMTGGNIHFCRFYSIFLSLHIKAQLLGLTE